MLANTMYQVIQFLTFYPLYTWRTLKLTFARVKCHPKKVTSRIERLHYRKIQNH